MDIEIRGRYLGGATRIEVSGRGVEARILDSSDALIKASVTVTPDAPPYRRDLRVYTPQGTFVQVFEVGVLDEQMEAEPNNDPQKAQPVQLPVVINGKVTAGDYDCFRFHGETGQVLLFDLESSRVGTRFDAVLWLLDENGRELAFEDDAYFDKDPRLIYRVTRSGNYVLRAGGFRESGSAAAEYRLVMGELPFASYVFPAGARRGGAATVTVTGVNLDRVSGALLDGLRLPVEIAAKEKERLTLRLKPEASIEPGEYRLRLNTSQGPLPNALPFVISDFRELVLDAPPSSKPFPLDAPTVVNGVIRRPKQTDNFFLDVAAGEQVMLQGDAMSLGNFLDPAVTIYDSGGGVIAYIDEVMPNGFDKEPTTVDFRLTHKFERAGRYRVEFRDASLRGHESFVYRLLIAQADPRFEVQALSNQVSAVPGQTTLLPVRVRRYGGWDAPVEVWVEGLPQRVESKRMNAEATNTRFRGTFGEDFFFDGTNVDLPLQVHEGAPAGVHALRIRARGMAGGKTLERTATVWYPWQQSGYLRGPSDDQRLLLTIGRPPVFDLEGPTSLQLPPGKSTELTLTLRWFGDSKPDGTLRIEAERLPPGVRVERFEVLPGGAKVSVWLHAEEGLLEPTGWLRLAAVLPDRYQKAAPDIELKFVKEENAHAAAR